MSGAWLRGWALDCALGADEDACFAAVAAGKPPVSKLRLDNFNEPFALHYYRIDDGADLFDPARLARRLPGVVAAAVDTAGLDARARRALPIFVGSSCFSIGESEARYAAALAHDPDAALAMPCVGFEGIAASVRAAIGSEAPSYTWNTACTSSANALLAAQRMLAAGRFENALVIGAELANLTSLAGFAALQLTADAVRPFAAARAGIVLGEGIGAVVLSATPRGAPPLCLVGGAANCDCYSVSGANPDGNSIAAVLRTALTATGTAAEAIRGIKAHGTGTAMNDAGEARGLAQVFEALPPVCVLKPWIGHTLGACGVNELALFAAALRRGVLPGAPDAGASDEALAVGPLVAAAPAAPGRYLLNQFGFGGTNTVLVLEWAA